MKKKFAVIIILLLVGALISYQFIGKSDFLQSNNIISSALEETVSVVKSSPEKVLVKSLTSDFSPHNLKPYSDSVPDSVQLAADEKKREIELLVNEFNSHLDDVNMRKSIKIRIDKALAEYNKIILPIAVEQVRASN